MLFRSLQQQGHLVLYYDICCVVIVCSVALRDPTECLGIQLGTVHKLLSFHGSGFVCKCIHIICLLCVERKSINPFGECGWRLKTTAYPSSTMCAETVGAYGCSYGSGISSYACNQDANYTVFRIVLVWMDGALFHRFPPFSLFVLVVVWPKIWFELWNGTTQHVKSSTKE